MAYYCHERLSIRGSKDDIEKFIDSCCFEEWQCPFLDYIRIIPLPDVGSDPTQQRLSVEDAGLLKRTMASTWGCEGAESGPSTRCATSVHFELSALRGSSDKIFDKIRERHPSLDMVVAQDIGGGMYQGFQAKGDAIERWTWEGDSLTRSDFDPDPERTRCPYWTPTFPILEEGETILSGARTEPIPPFSGWEKPPAGRSWSWVPLRRITLETALAAAVFLLFMVVLFRLR